MQRVLVIGSGGAGKTRFAQALALKSGLPLIHLDALFWQPGWVEPANGQWISTIEKLIAAPRWIMDGNYGGTMATRIAACDTVIFLDMPTYVCLWRVVKRRFAHQGRARAEMPDDCHERLSWRFLGWIASYRQSKRPGILSALSRLRADQRAVVLGSPHQVAHFLETVPAPPAAS